MSHVRRVEEAIDQAADAATEYWLGIPLAADQCTKQEARLLGLQIRLDGAWESIANRLAERDVKEIDRQLNGLTEVMTGSYHAAERRVDADRARLAQMYASEAITLVTAAVDRALTVSGWWLFVRERAARRQRGAIGY